MFRAIEARLIFHDGGIGTAKIPAERSKSFCTHIKKVTKNPNDRMLDKSGEFFLKPCVFKGLYYSSHWWVLLRSWSVPGGFWSVPDGFWLVLLGSRFSIRGIFIFE